MSFFRRGRAAVVDAVEANRPAVAPPPALRDRLTALVAMINTNGGRLPVESLVSALDVTDTLSEVIDAADSDGFGAHAMVTLEGILDDYLPTTLRSFLSLEPSATEVPRPSGVTPRASLLEQLDALSLAASDLLVAARNQDADALLTQGNFLRTKFSRSDLDL